MGLTTADLIEDTKRRLMSGQAPAQNKLAAPTVASASSLLLEHSPNGIQEGGYVQVGLEVFYVWSVNEKTALVEPAQQGSSTFAHDQGALVVANPKFPDHVILRAINDELASLSSPTNGLFAIRTVDLWTDQQAWYDLDGASGFIDIIDVRMNQGNNIDRDWPLLTNYEVAKVASDDFPSGLGLHITDSVWTGAELRVRYRAEFSPLTTLADDVVKVSGLPSTALDIPSLGAAIRLVHPREIKRNFSESQGDGRRAGEVPPGSVSGSVNALERDYRRRINEEKARLSQFSPPTGFVPRSGPYTQTRRRLWSA